MREGRIRPSLGKELVSVVASRTRRNEGGANSPLVAGRHSAAEYQAARRNEGGANSPLVAGRPRTGDAGRNPAAMREGRIRPSLNHRRRNRYRPGNAAMREGRIRPSLQPRRYHQPRKASAAMREGRIRPSLLFSPGRTPMRDHAAMREGRIRPSLSGGDGMPNSGLLPQ